MKELGLEDLCKGNIYHVCTNGLEQVVLLRNDEDHRVAWNYLALCGWKARVRTLVFSLMSNHVHVLVLCNDSKQADLFIKIFKKSLSLYLKKQYGLTKVLHRTQDCITQIDSVQYLKNCIAYILRNAICARICAKPEDYPWSSYQAYFSQRDKNNTLIKVAELSFTQKRRLLKTNMDLSGCPLRIDLDGKITLDSWVNADIVEKAYKHSGKSFLYYLGCCNDATMEYELEHQPLIKVSDNDMYAAVQQLVAKRFHGKDLSELTSSEKCSILKQVFFNNKTSIPQLSRILGLPRQLIRQIMSS